MIRFLLLLLAIVFYAGDQIGINISVAPGMSTKNVLLYLIFIGLAVTTAVTRSRKFEMRDVIVPFLLLVLYGTATWSVIVSIMHYPNYDAGHSLIRLKSALFDQFFIFLVFFYGVLTKDDALWLLKTLVWVVLIGNVVTVIDSFNVPNLNLATENSDGRYEGFFGAVNSYASFTTLYLPASVAVVLSSRGVVRLLAGIGVFASILALIMTFSRGSYVGILFGSIIAAFYLRRLIDTKNVVRAIILASLTLSVFVVILIAVGRFDFLEQRFSLFGGSSHTATSGRSTIWSTAIESMLANPLSFLTGYGWDSYASSREFYAATHNMYLNYLYNLGIIGLGLFLTIFRGVLRNVRNAIETATEDIRPQLVAVVFGVCCFLVSIFFGDYVGYLDWAYMALVLRLAVEAGVEGSKSKVSDLDASRDLQPGVARSSQAL